MNKTLSAQRMYFLSAALFSVGFIASYIAGFLFPYPEIDVDQTTQIVDMILWVIPVAGLVLFVLGLTTNRTK